VYRSFQNGLSSGASQRQFPFMLGNIASSCTQMRNGPQDNALEPVDSALLMARNYEAKSYNASVGQSRSLRYFPRRIAFLPFAVSKVDSDESGSGRMRLNTSSVSLNRRSRGFDQLDLIRGCSSIFTSTACPDHRPVNKVRGGD
jgi:hypothetical protein